MANPDAKRRRGPDGRYRGKCDPETVEKILLGLRSGCSLETSADYAGVSESTLTRWRQRVEAGTGSRAERDFVVAVNQTVAEVKISLGARLIRDADPRTLLEYMSRRWPREFGQIARLAVEANVTGEVHHAHDGELRLVAGDVSALDDQELEQLHALLKKAHDAKLEKAGQLLQLPPGRRAASSPG